MNNHVLCAFAALILSLGFASRATAQSTAEERLTASRLCQASVRGIKPPAGKYAEDVLEEHLYQAAGVTPADSEATRKRKVAEMFKRRPPASGGSRGLPYCDGRSLLWEGSLLWSAVDSFWTEGALWMIIAGADPNLVDSKTGRTLLDDVQRKMDAFSRAAEAYAGPHSRDRTLVDGLAVTYRQLREYGAKHAFELNTSAVASTTERERRCLEATPTDAPGEVGSFDGILNSKLSELTPGTVPGGTRVSSRQAACLMEAFGKDIMVVGVISDDVGLPDSIKFPFIGYSGTFDDKFQSLSGEIVKIAGSKPILVYCHSTKCYLSYNAAVRLREAGASKVYWLRDGINGWRNSGYPIATPDDFLYRMATRKN